MDETEKQLIHNLNVALSTLGKEIDETRKEIFAIRAELEAMKAREFTQGHY